MFFPREKEPIHNDGLGLCIEEKDMGINCTLKRECIYQCFEMNLLLFIFAIHPIHDSNYLHKTYRFTDYIF